MVQCKGLKMWCCSCSHCLGKGYSGLPNKCFRPSRRAPSDAKYLPYTLQSLKFLFGRPCARQPLYYRSDSCAIDFTLCVCVHMCVFEGQYLAVLRGLLIFVLGASSWHFPSSRITPGSVLRGHFWKD